MLTSSVSRRYVVHLVPPLDPTQQSYAQVHGNSDLLCTTKNAARCLYAFCADKGQKVHMGAAKPLIRHVRHDPEIHGVDGLGGVRGLPDANSNLVKSIVSPIKAIDGMAASMKFVMDELREKVSIVSSGPMTNVALFISVYPELLYCVEEIVFMGGGVGIGNRGAVAGERHSSSPGLPSCSL